MTALHIPAAVVLIAGAAVVVVAAYRLASLHDDERAARRRLARAARREAVRQEQERYPVGPARLDTVQALGRCASSLAGALAGGRAVTSEREYRVTVRVPVAEMPRVEGVRGPALAGFDVITVEEITAGGWWRRVPMDEVFGARRTEGRDAR